MYIIESSFSQIHKICINGNIGIRGFSTWKQKNPPTKYYPIEYWTWDLKKPFWSNGFVSEFSRHVLLGISSNCLLFLHHFNLKLRSLRTKRAWPYEDILDVSSNTWLDSSERRTSEPNVGPRFNITGVILLLLNLICLLLHKASDTNIAIITNFGYFVKNSITLVLFT